MLKTNIFIFLTILTIAFIFFLSFKVDGNYEYNPCLKKSYDSYLKEFMSKDGRIIDPDRNNVTTSEGQSYMLLKSVVLNDQKTFDLVYKWSKNNLQRKDKLFAWLWGKSPTGEYKILDNNSATDADIDIAFVLLIAYEKWNDEKYLKEAIPIINSIWNNETKRIGYYLILMPGVAQTYSDKIEINPSYFSPYQFRFFQKYDAIHDWNCLIDSSYYYLNQVMSKTQTGLPPNWFLIEAVQNKEQIVLEDSERSDFSYDAVRVFQRIYLDYVRTGEKRALPILAHSKFFIDKWIESGEDNKNFYVNYKADGQLRDKDKFIGSIAILIPVISVYDSNVAAEMYKKEVEPYFENEGYWKTKHDYYGKNLLWFGCYFYNQNSKEYKDMHKRRIIGY
jgi:endoglucanase